MKRTLTVIALGLALATSAQAGYRGGYNHHHHVRSGSGWGWVVPAVIGGLVVYGATRPAQAEQPVIVQPLPPQAPPVYQCPPGTMMFYEKRLVGPDYNGRYVEGLVPVCR